MGSPERQDGEATRNRSKTLDLRKLKPMCIMRLHYLLQLS